MILQPDPGTTPSRGIEGRNFALYVDGKRVKADPTIRRGSDGITINVEFTTAVGALDDETVDPTLEIAWAGWKPGDTCHLHQPSSRKLPENGFVQIDAIHAAKNDGDATFFECTAMTPIYDWEAGDVMICGASERLLIPATWFQK